jgi:superfamily II DNA or RNA helicase
LFELSGFRWWLLRHGCEPGVFGGFSLTEDTEAVRLAMAKISKSIFSVSRGARMRKEQIPNFPKTHVATRLITDETGKAPQLALDLAEAYENSKSLEALTAIRMALELLRVDALGGLAEDYALTSKVIIFVNYTATAEALRKRLFAAFGGVPTIDGSNDTWYREAIKVSFQRNEIPVLICNNQAGGEGISLHDPKGQVERTSLISPCYSGRQMKQVLGRPQRDGGAFSQQFFIYFADTPEERIAAEVERKLGNLDALNDAELNGVFPC